MQMSEKTFGRWGARLLVPLLGYLGVAPLASAQVSHPCANMSQPAKRLACYDEAFPPVVALRDAVREQAQQDFGRQAPSPGLELGEPREVADPDQIESSIAKLAYANGRRIFTLDNGHVWATVDAASMGHAVEGDRVRVRKGALGSYILETPAGVGLRVRRTR